MTLLERARTEDEVSNEDDVVHYVDPAEFPIAFCGRNIENDGHYCPTTCSCGTPVCPACDAIAFLEGVQKSQ